MKPNSLKMGKMGSRMLKWQNRGASVLILVLIVISSMTILAVGLAYRVRIEMQLAHSSSQRIKAHYLALAGIERCKALLAEKELSPQRAAYLSNFASNTTQEKLLEELKITKVDESTELAYGISDEKAFININKSDPAVLQNLGCISKEQIACILDWIDKDSDTNPGGAEDDFYERSTPPYQCKNAPINSIKELMFIKNITNNDFYGRFGEYSAQPDKNLLLLKDSSEDVKPGLVSIFSVYGDGKININTVSKRILSAMPGLDEQAAEIVLRYRSGPDGQSGSDDDNCIEKAEDILKIEGLTKLQAELLQQYCCFNSDMFRIISYAKVREDRCLLMAIVKVAEKKPDILSIDRLL